MTAQPTAEASLSFGGNPLGQPSRAQLRVVFFHAAVPMIGFGLMDNTVMIQAGDLIDSTIGVRLGLSTLTAAAFGQIFSDVSGVVFGGTVEAAATKLGLPVPHLSKAQRVMPVTKFWATAGGVVGVMFGCLLAMTQLLWMDLGKADRARRKKELETLFRSLMAGGHRLVHAQHCTLWLVDSDGRHLWSRGIEGDAPERAELAETFRKYDTGADGYITPRELCDALAKLGRRFTADEAEEMIRRVKRRRQTDAEAKAEEAKAAKDDDAAAAAKDGAAAPQPPRKLPSKVQLGRHDSLVPGGVLFFEEFVDLMQNVILPSEVRVPIRATGMKGGALAKAGGAPTNVPDVYRDPRFYKQWDEYTGYRTKSLLMCPVVSPATGETLGLVEMINKKRRDGSGFKAFNENDERLVKMLCEHAAIFIDTANRGELKAEP